MGNLSLRPPSVLYVFFVCVRCVCVCFVVVILLFVNLFISMIMCFLRVCVCLVIVVSCFTSLFSVCLFDCLCLSLLLFMM